MVTLIEQMLDLSRIEVGKVALASEAVHLPEIIEQVRQDIAPLAEAKGLQVAIDVCPDLPVLCLDAMRVRQILLNLAGNAVKFTEQGTITLSAVAAADGGADIAVQDTGIGIAESDLEAIFQEFRQIDGEATRRHGGAGLGLGIARGLAELMGGSISVVSVPGAGSIFTLHLPG
jgi:signal transduction histidine kinase